MLFTQSDVNQFDRSYFRLLGANAFTITVQSKNTQHCWHIELSSGRTRTLFFLYHTHRINTRYHYQCYAFSLSEIIDIIQSHDVYQLRKIQEDLERKRMRRTITSVDSNV